MINWRSRRALIIGSAAAALLVLTLALFASTRTRPRREPPPRRDSAAQTMPGTDMGGMDMPPTSSDGSVALTPGQVREFGITFGAAEVRTLETEVRTVGTVTIDESRVVKISPKFGGFAERLYVNVTGQRVGRGTPLLEVYSPELVAAQHELLLAQRLQRTIGRSTVPGVPQTSTDLAAAARERLRLWDVSEAQIAAVSRTGQVKRTITLYSPASGVVVEKNVVQGQSFQAGQELYTIANLAQVWVDAELRESDVANVRAGAGADIELNAYPGRTFKGRVAYLLPTLTAETRTTRARILVANTGEVMKPGMYATVRIRSPQQSALTVPVPAVLRTGERDVVFVDMGGGRLMPHTVRLGKMTADYAEVLSGLEAGQRVVTSAQFLLESESNLGEVMRAMVGQGAGMGTRR